MYKVSISRSKNGSIPGALRLASSHDEVLTAWLPGDRFHEAGALLGLLDLVNALSLSPVPALPGHLSIAGHGIGHRPHAATEQRGVIRGKREAVNSAAVM